MNSKLLALIPQGERDVFKNRLEQVCSNIGCYPDELLALMHLESGLKPTAVNPTTKAVGLIQFMPKTLKWLGYTFEQVYAMTATQQLDVVAKYFKAFQKPKSFVDLYLTIFYPAAVGKSSGYTFGNTPAEQRLIGQQNPIFNGGKPVTVQSVNDYLKKRFSNLELNVRWSRSTIIKALATVLVAFALINVFFNG